MPRILIFAYYFYPSRAVGAKRVSELACHLREAGWDVTVLTAPTDGAGELLERIRGLERITVTLPRKLYPLLGSWPRRLLRHLRPHGPGSAGETGKAGAAPPAPDARRETMLAWLERHYHALEMLVDDRKLWSLFTLLRALWLRRRFDWVLSSGPVHSVHLAARLFAGANGARWIMDLRDPWVCNHSWPDKDRSRSALRDRIEGLLERDAVMHATCVTVASPGIANALAARVPAAATKLQLVLNGYDGAAAPSAQSCGMLRLLYAGSLYLNRDPFPLLGALRDLVNMPSVDRHRVRFTLVGQCSQWNGRDVIAWIREAQLDDVVRVVPPVPPTAVAGLMRQAEVLVNFAQGQPEQIPAKVYEYIGAGREMLLIAETDSDAARITRESGAGRIVDPRDPHALPTVLRELYVYYVERRLAFAPDENAIRRFSRTQQNNRFLALLAAPVVPGGS